MSGEKTLLYYSIPDITLAYKISRPTLKKKILSGEIYAEKLCTSVCTGTTFKYVIPETELVKLEYCKKNEPIASEMSQPSYYEEYERREKERLFYSALKRAEFEATHSETYRVFVENYKKYLQSEKWQEVRHRRLEIDGYQCRLCKKTAKNLHVHHVCYEHLGQPEEINDVVTLCPECHHKIHEYDCQKKEVRSNEIQANIEEADLEVGLL